MNKSNKNISKLILSCSIGASLFFTPAFAATPTATVSKTQAGESKAINLRGGVAITNSSQLISLSLRDSDVRQVLRMLADKAGLNIIFHDSVSGKVTLDLVNVNLNKAFEYVLTVNGLRYWVDNETLIVASKDAASELGINRQEIRPIKIKYLDAAKVAKFLNTNIFSSNNPAISGNQIVITNPLKNEILVFGTDKDAALARQVVSYLDVKPETRAYNVNHMAASKMASLVCKNVFSAENADEGEDPDGKGGGKIACEGKTNVTADKLESLEERSYYVQYFPDLGRITVTGATTEQFAEVEKFIKDTDKKQPQVYIELSIIELNENGSKTLSSLWSFSNGKFGLDGGAQSAASGKGGWSGIISTPLDQLATLPDPITGEDKEQIAIPGGIMWKGIKNTFGPTYQPGYAKTLQQFISMQLTEDKGRLLANPKIIATNNQESKINISSDYISGRTVNVETTDGAQTRTIEYETDQAGIEISIKPTISPDGYVTLTMKPSYTSPATTIVDPANSNEIILTLVNTRDLELNNVRIKDGETLVVGGLIQEQESKSVKKIPVLGDIPVMGALFRATSKEKTKSELVIMVTPKIIHDDEDVTSI